MYKLNYLFSLLLLLLYATTISAQTLPAEKARLVTAIENRDDALIALSDSIWSLAEVAFEETGSAELLATFAEAEGVSGDPGRIRYADGLYGGIRER